MKELIEGIELFGRYKDSGYNDKLYLIKTPQHKYIQVSKLLYQTIAAMQQVKTLAGVAERVSNWENKDIEPDAISYLIDTKLQPLGIIKDHYIIYESPKKHLRRNTTELLDSLKYRCTLVPEKFVQPVAALYSIFFYSKVVYLMLACVLGVNIWLFGFHGISSGLRQVLFEPMLFLGIFGLILLSSLFHEIGHAAGAYYGGSKPGKIGAGIYLIWPAFYTDISDIYRLGRKARIRSDFGGVYFNLIFSLMIALVYSITQFEPLLLLILVQNISVFHQLLPFLRLDGYFILSDIVGVPDLFKRIGPMLQSILRRKNSYATKDLKPWVKWVVTIWIFVTIPIMIFITVLMFVNAPNIIYSAYISASLHLQVMITSFQQGNYFDTAVRALQLIILVLPSLGVGTIMYLLGKTFVKKLYIKLPLSLQKGFF